MLYAFMYHVLPLRIVDVSLQESPTRKTRELSMLYAIVFKALYLDYTDVQEFLPKFVLNVQSLSMVA